MSQVFHRPASLASPSDVTRLAGDQPSAVPPLSSDPTRDELPVDGNGDPVPILFTSTGGGTGEEGDLIYAAPDGSGGVDVTVAADTSAAITLGIDATGLL